MRNRDSGVGWGAAAVLSLVYSVYRLLVNCLDEDRAVRLGIWATHWLHASLRERRRGNYQKFFGTIDPKRDEKLDADYLSFMGRMSVEVIRDSSTNLEVMRSRSEFWGGEHIDEALKLGKGVMLLGAHMGNFYAYHEQLSLHGYRAIIVSQRIPVPSMERQVDRLRKRFNMPSIFVDQNAARVAVKTFRANGILSLMFEVVIRGEKAVALPFGAGRLPLDIGPALLAVRFGVPVLPVNVYSERPFHPRIHVQSPLPAAQGESESERALHLLKLWRDWLQDSVMKRPEQWWAWEFVKLQASH